MSEDCCPGDALQINMIGMHRSILGSLSPSEYSQVRRYLLQRYTLEEYTFECLRGSQSAHNAPHVWRLFLRRCTPNNMIKIHRSIQRSLRVLTGPEIFALEIPFGGIHI